MYIRSTKQVAGLITLIAGLTCSLGVRAQSILPGYCLLTTVPTNQLLGLEWQGVPIGSYDFGSGAQSVGDSCAIVDRSTAISSDGGSSPIQFVAGQLETSTSVPANYFYPGSQAGFYYITLDQTYTSTGTMTNDAFPSTSSSFDGVWNGTVALYADLRFGSVTGTAIATNVYELFATNVAWGETAPSGALEIPGVNYLLNGVNTTNDFWLGTSGSVGGKVGNAELRTPQSVSQPSSSLVFFDPANPSVRLEFLVSVLPSLTITQTGTTITVSWTPQGGTLQSSSSLGGAWTTIGTANPTTLPIGSSGRLFRVSMP